MSKWKDLSIHSKVEDILEPISGENPNHHLGGPFLTAYQLAIEYAQRFPEDLRRLDLPVGGKDSGVHYSLAQYLARQLSGKIKSREITSIEGCLMSNRHVIDLVFNDNGTHVHSSLSGKHASLSMFRLIIKQH